jgi:hypothetical protein
MFKTITAVIILFSLAVQAKPNVKTNKTFLPPNDLYKQDKLNNRNANITEAEFNQIIDQVIIYWQPLAQKHGANLTVEKKWNDPTVNAYASQYGSTWNVAMFGGLARRPEITDDGFALVVCHEVGHHFGGFSFYDDYDWASAEGQSDYFATQACARRIWAGDKIGNAKYQHELKDQVDPIAKKACDTVWSKPEDQALCYRSSVAGHSLAKLLAVLGGDSNPSFATPDKSVVTDTNVDHPAGQCRLDTFFAGALCNKEFDENIIPGKDHANGQTSADAEADAFKYTCFKSQNDNVGYRPACWFKELN